MRRTVFNEDHEAFRETIRAFIEAEVVPVYDEWFAAGQAPRDFYYKLGELGVFGINVPEEFGGAGLESHKFEAVMYEEVGDDQDGQVLAELQKGYKIGERVLRPTMVKVGRSS